MQRRKFLIGAGSLAAGSAAAIGTGAFSFTTMGREFRVNIANDPNAYLGLEPMSDYATLEGGELVLDFTNNGYGNGLNDNANTFFNNVFRITNQGTNPINLEINNHEDSWPFFMYHTDGWRNETNTSYNDLKIFWNFGDHPYSDAGWWSPTYDEVVPAYLELGPGADAYVHMEMFLSDSDSIPDTMDTSESGFPSEINMYANAIGSAGDYS